MQRNVMRVCMCVRYLFNVCDVRNACARVRMYVCAYLRIYICVCVCVFMCVLVYVWADGLTHVCVYV